MGEPYPGVGPAEDIGPVVHLVVDLVEGDPVFHLTLISSEAGFRIIQKEVDDPAVGEAAVFGGQRVGDLEVGEGNNGLDAMPQQLVEDRVVEGQALLVGSCFVASGKDPGPGDGGAEAFESQLSQQGDVLPEPVVEIDALVVWVVQTGEDPVGDSSRLRGGARGHDVSDAQTLGGSFEAALKLVRGKSAAPEKILVQHSCLLDSLPEAEASGRAGEK